MSSCVPSQSGATVLDHSDPEYQEFQQFQHFKALLRSTGGTLPLQQQPSFGGARMNNGDKLVPEHLGNPSYIYQEEVNGFLSKQFPTIGNPAPLGLCGFALTTFVLSMYNVGATVATSGPQGVVMGLALFYGGGIQLLAGMWELRTGNTFGAVAFSSYGGFWMSFAALFIDAFGFLDTYTDSAVLANALGIYLFSWCIFSVLMTIASHRTSVVLVTLFATVALTFLMLSIGHWADSVNCIQAGGAFGILAAVIAWYAAMAALLTKRASYFQLPVWSLEAPEPQQTNSKLSGVELSKV